MQLHDGTGLRRCLHDLCASRLKSWYLLDVPMVTFSFACAFGIALALALWIGLTAQDFRGGWNARNVFFMIWTTSCSVSEVCIVWRM